MYIKKFIKKKKKNPGAEEHHFLIKMDLFLQKYISSIQNEV